MAEAIKKADERRARRQKSLHEEFGRRFDTMTGAEAFEAVENLNEWFEKIEEKIYQLWAIEMLAIVEVEN